jgi:hypothetical protein
MTIKRRGVLRIVLVLYYTKDMKTAPPGQLDPRLQLGQKVSFWDRLRSIKNDKKQFRIVVLFLLITSLLGIGIVITILEQLDSKEPKKAKETFEVTKIEKQPGEMVWLLYWDKNDNQVFDYSEQVVKDVSVAIKRPGDEDVWRVQPADVNGVVRMTDLPVGEYEMRLDINDQVEVGEVSFFPNEYKFQEQFLPSAWQSISLGEEGYEARLGLKKYQVEKVVVVEDSLGLRLVDLVTQRDFGWLRSFKGLSLQGDRLFYLGKNQLMEFDFELKSSKVVVDRLYNVEGKEYLLSQDLGLVVYKEGEEFRYRAEECGEGQVIIDGQRLIVIEMMLDIWSDQELVLAGRVGSKGEPGVFKVKCNGKKMAAEKLMDKTVTSLGYLDEQTLFYSDSSGSYFYDLISQKRVKYSALGSGVEAEISEDRKYIYGRVNGKLMVVDYPAVEASGVEKHYLLDVPTGLELDPVFVGDEMIYLNKNQVVRINLKGNGVWAETGRTELKGFQALGILGEIRF